MIALNTVNTVHEKYLVDKYCQWFTTTHSLEQDQMEVGSTWDKTQSLHRGMSSTFVSSSFSRLHAGFSVPSRKNQEGGMRGLFLCFAFF